MMIGVAPRRGTAQTAAQFVRVDGMAYDSLSKRPLRDAFVSVTGTARSTTSDNNGRFRLDSVPVGEHQFVMQHAAFDSIGLSGVSARVLVQPKMARLVLAVPSFATLWGAACGDSPVPRDSVLVYGSVRDAANGAAAANAAVEVSWVDLVGGGRSLASIGQRKWRRETTTDRLGEFALCGVPIGTALTLRSALDPLDSLSVSTLALDASTVRVRRYDMLVARVQPVATPPEVDPTTVARDTNASATSTPATQVIGAPTGVLIGTVTTAAGAPIGNAAVAVDTMPEIRTGEDGRFIVREVPAGSRQVSIVAIGLLPLTVTVNLLANDTVRMTIPMSAVTTLSAVKVVSTVISTRIRGYEERKRNSNGAFRDSTELKNYPEFSSVLRTVPSVTIRGRGLGGLRIGSCSEASESIDWRIDGHPTTADVVAVIDMQSIAATEIYRRGIPSELMGKRGYGCAVWIWTKRGLGR
jgi:hypothetical protein